MRSERGQAAVECTGAMLVVAVTFAAAAAAGGTMVASAAPAFARAIRCALLQGCHGEDARLGAAYGGDAAALVRAYAPNVVYERRTLTLPVDFRRCRSHACADAADARGADVWQAARGGAQATVFTHVVDRRPGGSLYVQYWLYYPDSTYLGPALALSKVPIVGAVAKPLTGHHADDWESYQLRIDTDGRVFARASAHHGYAGRKHWPNLNEANIPYRRRTGAWTPATGWTRVSRGSHAGHVVGSPGTERRTEADGIDLVPIETLPPAARAHAFAISPPWEKPVYRDPGDSGT